MLKAIGLFILAIIVVWFALVILIFLLGIITNNKKRK